MGLEMHYHMEWLNVTQSECRSRSSSKCSSRKREREWEPEHHSRQLRHCSRTAPLLLGAEESGDRGIPPSPPIKWQSLLRKSANMFLSGTGPPLLRQKSSYLPLLIL